MTLEEQYRRDTGKNAFVARGECGSESYKYIMWLESTLARVTGERDELIKVINYAVETIYDSAIGSGCVARDLLEAAISRIKEEGG